MRRPWLDVLKGACIWLVVLNHAVLWPMRSGDSVAAFVYGMAFGSVAAFSATAGYLAGLHPRGSGGASLRRRVGQLLLPWVLWAPVYAAVPFLWRWLSGPAVPTGFAPGPWARAVALGGGPLWFLPVLFAATVLCTYLDARTASWWPTGVALAAYALTACLAWRTSTSPLALGRGTFWAVSPLYAGCYWYGLRVARDGIPKVPEWARALVVAASMLLGGFVTLAAARSSTQWLMWLPYAIGAVGGCSALALAVGATRTPGRGAAMLARTGVVSLGAYVLHPAVVTPAMLLVPRDAGVAGALAVTVVAVFVATELARRAQTVPVLRAWV